MSCTHTYTHINFIHGYCSNPQLLLAQTFSPSRRDLCPTHTLAMAPIYTYIENKFATKLLTSTPAHVCAGCVWRIFTRSCTSCGALSGLLESETKGEAMRTYECIGWSVFFGERSEPCAAIYRIPTCIYCQKKKKSM